MAHTTPCRPADASSGPLVVLVRPVPVAKVADAVRVTARCPAVHGTPVHVGDAVEIADGDVPVLRAHGVTPRTAVMASRPSLAITHAPGHVLITDVRDEGYPV